MAHIMRRATPFLSKSTRVQFCLHRYYCIDKFSPKVEELAHQILSLNAFEMMQMMTIVKQKLNITDAMLSSNMGGGGGGSASAAAPAAAAAPAQPAVVEKTEFVVKLVSFDETAKFKILKELRVLNPDIKLMEAKALVEKLPAVLGEKINKLEAERWQEVLTKLGATIELE